MQHRIEIETLEGTGHVTVTEHFAGTADRLAFEDQFGVSSTKLALLDTLFDDAGNVVRTEDGQLPPGHDEFREAWLVFLAWRCCAREIGAFQGVPFDQFKERVAGVNITAVAPADEAAAAPLSDATGTPA